jgi:hypothetical protein
MRQIFELNFIRFVLHPNHGEEMFFEEQEMALVIDLITLLMELFVNCSESNDRASVQKMTSGSMKVT